jgi:hypothetical protein
MAATSRELVYQTLEFRSPCRAPRILGVLPWASTRYEKELEEIRRDFPEDIQGIWGHQSEAGPGQGDPFVVGRYVDDWGCVFENIQAGVHGEVKEPLIADWKTDAGLAHVPIEWAGIDRDAVNRDCAATEKYTIAGVCPRPFEQLQFLRGSEDLYADLAVRPPEMMAFLRRMQEFYCHLLELWVQTDVDAVNFMDDWGSQRGLLIHPNAWRELFKPLYRDYVQIAHAAGKKIHMHSDGHITAIMPDLVEIGVDSVNAQLFCMGVENLKPFAGKITFWGEIDRQDLLPNATTEEIDLAVRSVHANLWRSGGCIAHCEFGPGARPENVRQVFASWDSLATAAQ